MLNRPGLSIQLSLLLGALAASSAACGDDAPGEGTNAGGSAGTTSAAAGTTSSSGGTGTSAGMGADAYCAAWVQKCGPDNKLNIVIPVELKNFDDLTACKPYYESSTAACRECLQLHTDAVHDGSWDHCIHGAGESLDPKCGCVIK